LSKQERFGLSAALTMPFDSVGAIDSARAVRHALWCLQNGCGSVTLFGTTGEGSSVSSAERGQTIKAFIDGGIPAGKIVIGVMANSVDDAAAQAREGLDAGCRGVLLAPPSYFKGVSDAGLFAWFSGVFAALGSAARDIIVYNIPSVTAVELSVDLIGRLKSAFPGIVTGVKDSSGNWSYTEKLLAAHKDIAILIGDERSLVAGVRLGGQGAISGLANIHPDRLLPMINDGVDDESLVAFVNKLVQGPVTPAVKAMLAHRTNDPAWRRVRAPLVEMPAELSARLASVMDETFNAERTAAQ
jgi:4-hydroxy-tetrahydrodipicolinate synthase